MNRLTVCIVVLHSNCVYAVAQVGTHGYAIDHRQLQQNQIVVLSLLHASTFKSTVVMCDYSYLSVEVVFNGIVDETGVFVQVSQGKWKSRSNYCPIDLFSG